MKRDFPIGSAKKFRKAVELGLSKEVLRLDFDLHRCGTCEASPMTEIPDLGTGFVFVEVEDDLVSVLCYTSVGGSQGAETFAVLLLEGITVVVFLLEERRCV